MSSLKMAMGVSLLASVPALATPYEWNGADGTTTLGDVTVEKSGGVASLTGSNASWTYSSPSSFDSLTGVDLISATTLSSLTVADGVDFKARAGTLDQGEGALPATIAVNHARATFVASAEKPIVSTSTISGNAGVVAFTGIGTSGIEMGDSTYEIDEEFKSDWSQVIVGTRLSDLTAVSGRFVVATGTIVNGISFFFENDGTTASVQIQGRAGDSVMCSIIDFRQDGSDIRVRSRVSTVAHYSVASNPGYEEPGSFKFVIEEGGGGATKIYPTSPTNAGWWESSWCKVANVVLSLKSKPGSYKMPPSVVVSAASAMTANTGARIEFGDVQGSPVNVTVGHASAFLGVGCAVVHSNAIVTLSVNGTSSVGYGLAGEAWILLDPCAQMVSKGYFTVGGWQGIELGDGAEWKQLHPSGTYLSKLKYHGAKTIGNVNLGQGSNPEIAVDGRGKASVHEGVFNAYTYTSLTTTLKIADATGTPDADYVITGGIAELVAGSNNDMKFKKTGAGTLRIEGPFTAVRYPFQLTDGTLELGASGILTAQNNFTLEGGTLSAAAKTVNVCGTLKLTANSAVDVASDATLDFQSFADWTENARLTLTVAEGGRVHVGSAPGALLRRTSYNGKRCHIDENGYLNGDPQGMVLILR